MCVCVYEYAKVDMRYGSIANTSYTIRVQLVAYYIATVSSYIDLTNNNNSNQWRRQDLVQRGARN